MGDPAVTKSGPCLILSHHLLSWLYRLMVVDLWLWSLVWSAFEHNDNGNPFATDSAITLQGKFQCQQVIGPPLQLRPFGEVSLRPPPGVKIGEHLGRQVVAELVGGGTGRAVGRDEGCGEHMDFAEACALVVSYYYGPWIALLRSSPHLPEMIFARFAGEFTSTLPKALAVSGYRRICWTKWSGYPSDLQGETISFTVLNS